MSGWLLVILLLLLVLLYLTPPAPAPAHLLAVRPSRIHGVGLFARRGIEEGSALFRAIEAGRLTRVAKYINHSSAPNSTLMQSGGGEYVEVATAPIREGEEVTADYVQAKSVSGGLISGPEPSWR